MFRRKRRIVGLAASQGANLANTPSGSDLRSLILGEPSLLAYYEYEDVFGGSPPFFTSDSSPSGYDWTSNTNVGSLDQVTGQVGLGWYLVDNGAMIDPPVGEAFFPGIADFNRFTANDAFTVELWLQQRTPTPFFAGGAVRWGGLPGGDEFPFYLNISPAGGGEYNIEVQIFTDGGFASLFNYNTTPVTMSDGLWHHWAITYDFGAGSALYHNGVLVAPDAAAVTLSSTLVTPSRITWIYGDLHTDETAFYNEALSAATILAHYNAGIA